MVRVKNKTNVLENETPVRKHGFKKKKWSETISPKNGGEFGAFEIQDNVRKVQKWDGCHVTICLYTIHVAPVLLLFPFIFVYFK